MTDRFIGTVLLMSAGTLLAGGVPATWEFDLSTGAFPKGTETASLNGVLPDRSAYKHGYTEKGWTIDRLDNKGYVALSPTYTNQELASENILKLPGLRIEEGWFLNWEARSVYRHFPDGYRVMAYPEDGSSPVELYSVDSEDWVWRGYTVSLDAVAGKEVRIAFVCTSAEGYMLALTGIRVDSEVPDSSNDVPAQEEEDEFTRALVVDDATGMWCVNCPAGEIVLNGLRERFGKRLIILSTHVNDLLANPGYWEQLKYYSVPRMMLNRIRASEGENAKKFEEYYNIPASFAIEADLPSIEESSMKMKAYVKVSEEIDNSAGRYKVGFVVRGYFHKPDDSRFSQKNNCTQPSYGAYYFLPSEIPSALMYYENVTLTSETAFSGIEGSLPDVLVPGEKYEVEWETEKLALLDNEKDAAVVALVLDTQTGEIMNAALGEDPALSEIEKVIASSGLSGLISGGGDGVITTTLIPGEEYRLEVFSADGTLIQSLNGMAVGNDSFRLPLKSGMAVVRLSTSRSSQTIKIML